MYLLSMGGTGINDHGTNYNVNGIGIEKGVNIVFNALPLLLFESQFTDLRNATIIAAENIYGVSSNEAIQVVKAWNAVGVSGNCISKNIIGDPIICDTEVYTIENLESDADVTWSLASGSGPVFELDEDTPYDNQLTITNQKWYTTTTVLTANIDLPYCESQVLSSIEIRNENSSLQTGTYEQDACNFYGVYHPAISGNVSSGNAIFLHQGCMATISLNNMEFMDVTYSGTTDPLYWYYSSSEQNLYLQLPYLSGGIPFPFTISGDGACSDRSLLFFSYSNNGSYILVSPNPADELVEVTMYSESELTETQKASSDIIYIPSTEEDEELIDYEVRLWSETKGLIHKGKPMNKQLQIPTKSLNKGFYYIHIVVNDQIYKKKILVNH